MPLNHWLSPYMMEEASTKTPPSLNLAPISTAAFWASTASPRAGAFALNLNNGGQDHELLEEPAAAAMDDGSGDLSYPNSEPLKEPLFEKPLTPSDVGKLNRLVIPKQHAEKYFPLNGSSGSGGGGGGGDSGGGEKGLLLGFEDEVGKSWRFRYSYWNSSQSYVLTKGWSRFVKEKRLDAGDIVLFARHPNELGRLFIGWRRRSSGAPHPPCNGGNRGWSGLLYAAGHPYPTQSSNSVLFQTDSHAENQAREKNGNLKRLRLFGVNLEWDEDESGSSNTGQGQVHDHYSSHRRTAHAVSYVCDSTNI